MEKSTSFGPQAVSVVASVTAGLSTIVAAQLTKRFPISFHASTPRWKYTIFPLLGYLVVYVAFLVYGILRWRRLSGTLAFMASPGVPIHGFIWALIPQRRPARKAPSTEKYMQQCLDRKNPILLALTWIPFLGSTVVASALGRWQGFAVQIATAVSFVATGSTPENMPRARENSFGRGARYMLLPRPGARDDTIGYTVDLEAEELLEPIRLTMNGISAYQTVSEKMMGRLRPVPDSVEMSEVPIITYLDSFVSNFPLDRLHDMTGKLWRTLEARKGSLLTPAADITLLYGLVERMSYVAYRPTSCTAEERRVAMTLNFSICTTETETADSSNREAAVALMGEWVEAGRALVGSDAWAAAANQGENLLDLAVPDPADVLREAEAENSNARSLVATVGSVAYFIRYVYGHNEEFVAGLLRNVPLYHGRIRKDLTKGGACIPVVCRGMILSMKRNGLVGRHIDGHEWASAGGALRWGAGGYSLLDQAYARNSAVAYVAQLAIIVVQAVIEN